MQPPRAVSGSSLVFIPGAGASSATPESRAKALLRAANATHMSRQERERSVESLTQEKGFWQGLDWLAKNNRATFSEMASFLSFEMQKTILWDALFADSSEGRRLAFELLKERFKSRDDEGTEKQKEALLALLPQEMQVEFAEHLYCNMSAEQVVEVVACRQDAALRALFLSPLILQPKLETVIITYFRALMRKEELALIPLLLGPLFKDGEGIKAAKKVFLNLRDEEKGQFLSALPKSAWQDFLGKIGLKASFAHTLLKHWFLLEKSPEDRLAMVQAVCVALSSQERLRLWKDLHGAASEASDYMPLCLKQEELATCWERNREFLSIKDIRFFATPDDVRCIIETFTAEKEKCEFLLERARFGVVCPALFNEGMQFVSLPEVAGILAGVIDAGTVLDVHEALINQIPPFLLAMGSVDERGQYAYWIRTLLPYLQEEGLRAALCRTSDQDLLSQLKEMRPGLREDQIVVVFELLSASAQVSFLQEAWDGFQREGGREQQHRIYVRYAEKIGARFAKEYRQKLEGMVSQARERRISLAKTLEISSEPDETEEFLLALKMLFGSGMTGAAAGCLGLEHLGKLMQEKGLKNEADFAKIGVTVRNRIFVDQMIIQMGSSKSLRPGQHVTLSRLWETILSPRHEWGSREKRDAILTLGQILKGVTWDTFYGRICNDFPEKFKWNGRQVSLEELVFALYTLDNMQILKKHLKKKEESYAASQWPNALSDIEQ